MIRPPFAALKLSFALVLAALVLAVVGIVWSRGVAHDAQAALAREQAAYDDAEKKLARSRDQQRLVETHLNEYRALVGGGFVGDEDRLAWIEAVQLASRSVGLSGLEYRLSPRVAADPALAHGLPLGQTTMTLAMPLLVETDLPRFFAALRARAPGLYRVQGCRLSRPGGEVFEAVNQPRLKADCELLWYTVTAPAANTTP